jgi:magnesium-transporting ATPase (P-type)
VTVVCSDKTGTLTKNQMTVTRVCWGGTEFQLSGTGYEPSGEFAPPPHAGLLETVRAGKACNELHAHAQRAGRHMDDHRRPDRSSACTA